ncbi:spermatogenesis-associated protein 2-like protein [Rhynochetos jubatus]
MCAGSALRQEHREAYREEYRRCLDREFRRGRAGACSDPSFGERLRRRLQLEPALLGALQEDAPDMLARGLRGRPDPEPALRGLASAFRLLELAALNLYLFPWRKEFGTVQTFSGAYVHSLRPALPEADLARSFGRLGYEPRDQHRLAISRLPPGPELVAAACGFFACRLECEILVEVVLRLRPRRLRAEELLEARRLAGDVEACVEMLQQRGTQREADCGDSVDLYREKPASLEDSGGEDAAPSALWRDPGSPLGAWDVPERGWDRHGDSEQGQEPVPPAGNPDPDTSRLFLQQELGAGGRLSAVAAGRSSQVPGDPQALPPAIPQEAPELPCYQLHSCLRRGVLPSYCCTTCQQLHAGACAAGQACRTRHRGQELRGERQQRLWLQRTEVDMLLADSSGPWS